MKRGIWVSAVLFWLFASSACSMTKLNPVSLSWFEKKPATCDLAHQAEYAKAMEEASSVLSQSAQASQGEEGAPSRKAEKTTEEAVVHQFVIKNTGNDVLKITNVISNCGSSVGRHTQSIPPGKEGVVTIKLKPGACEESDVKSAIIVTNDTQKPAIAVKVKNAKGS